jgi:hypothetical protein
VQAVAGSETGNVDIALKREAVFTVRGKVLGPNGEPVNQAFVNISPREMGLRFGGGLGMRRPLKDGEFEIGGVRAGSWVVNAQFNGPNTDRLAGSAAIEVSGADVSGVVVRLGGGEQLKGSFVLEGTTSTKPDWAKFMVRLTTLEGMSFGGMQPPKTDENGVFTVPYSMPGKYLLNASGPGARDMYLASIKVGNEEYLGKEIDLTSGAPEQVKVIFRTNGGRVTVNVDPAGESVTNGRAMLVLMPVEPHLHQYPFIQMRPAGPGAPAEFANIRPGSYLAFAYISTEWNVMQDDELPKEVAAVAVKVQVDPSSTQTVQLKVVKVEPPAGN